MLVVKLIKWGFVPTSKTGDPEPPFLLKLRLCLPVINVRCVWRDRLAVKCARAQSPTNGNVHGADYTYGAVVMFSCLKGFHLEGSPG